jgi:hypothetical protein
MAHTLLIYIYNIHPHTAPFLVGCSGRKPGWDPAAAGELKLKNDVDWEAGSCSTELLTLLLPPSGRPGKQSEVISSTSLFVLLSFRGF